MSTRAPPVPGAPDHGFRYVGVRGSLCAAKLLTACAVFLSIQPAAAVDNVFGEKLDQDRAYNARSRGDVAALDKVIAAAHFNGRILDVRLRLGKYVFKLLDDNGRITTVDVDAFVSPGGWNGTGDVQSGGAEWRK